MSCTLFGELAIDTEHIKPPSKDSFGSCRELSIGSNESGIRDLGLSCKLLSRQDFSSCESQSLHGFAIVYLLQLGQIGSVALRDLEVSWREIEDCS